MSSKPLLQSEFPGDIDPEIAANIIQGEKTQSKSGSIIGFICILFGVVLLILGITGSVDWNIKTIGIESSLTNAAPGVVLIIVGFLIIFVTKFNIIVKK